MKQKNLVMLGVAVGCGLIAAVAVAKLSAGGNRGPETGRVLVAKKDIPLSTKLDEKKLDELLMWADMPKQLIPPDAVTDIESVKNKELNRTLKQGNPLSVTDIGESNNIELPDGCKAITLKATQVDATGGFAKPGARVDIMYVEKSPTGKTRAAIILKDMLVLAVGLVHTLREDTGPAIPQVENVTLAVTDKQAMRLALGDERGKMKLVLRDKNKSGDEKAMTGDEAIEWIDDPFEQTAAPAVAKVEPPKVEAPKLVSVVITKKAVPQNTLINADNVGTYFETSEMKSAPAGTYATADDLKGKFIVKEVPEGTFVFKSVTDDKAVEVKKPEEKKPEVVVEKKPEPKKVEPVVEKKVYPRHEQVIQEGGSTRRIIWLEVAPEQWKRFESEKDADAYKGPDAADATK